MRIGIAGIGGIGSNVARQLAQAGISPIRIVDFDRVEAGNLNRQFYAMDQTGKPKVDCLKDNLTGIFPRMKIETVNKRIEPGQALKIFKGCSLVVEGLDDPAAKKIWWKNYPMQEFQWSVPRVLPESDWIPSESGKLDNAIL